MLKALLATTLLAAAGAAFAQAPAKDPGQAPRKPRHDCSQAKDPKACEERREKFRSAAEKARAACESRPDAERRDCMRAEMCKQAKDPAKCEERAKAHAEKRKQRQEQNKK